MLIFTPSALQLRRNGRYNHSTTADTCPIWIIVLSVRHQSFHVQNVTTDWRTLADKKRRVQIYSKSPLNQTRSKIQTTDLWTFLYIGKIFFYKLWVLFGFYFEFSWKGFFWADLHPRNAANSGLFARAERVKMPKITSNKPKSSS